MIIISSLMISSVVELGFFVVVGKVWSNLFECDFLFSIVFIIIIIIIIIKLGHVEVSYLFFSVRVSEVKSRGFRMQSLFSLLPRKSA